MYLVLLTIEFNLKHFQAFVGMQDLLVEVNVFLSMGANIFLFKINQITQMFFKKSILLIPNLTESCLAFQLKQICFFFDIILIFCFDIIILKSFVIKYKIVCLIPKCYEILKRKKNIRIIDWL